MFIPADREEPEAGPAQAEEKADAEEPKEKGAVKRGKGGKRIKVNARQLRRNARIVGLVMHPEHKFGVAMWQDAAGVHHGCGPLAWRDVAVRSLADAVSGVAAAEKAAEGPARLFGAPEDAFTGLLSRSDVVAMLRMLGWKRLHADFKAGNVPEHMTKFTGGKFWARVASLPLSQGSGWKAKGDHLDLWKQDARGLLDLTAWQDSEPDAEAASQEGSKRSLVYMKDVFEVSGKTMKEARFAVLVGCVGVWLEWHHPGHYARTTPSDDYVKVWRELEIHSNPIIISTGASRTPCTTDFFTVVRNGVLFPIWRMKDCEHNDSAGGKGPLQNAAESLKIVWHTVTHPREEGASASPGAPLFGLGPAPEPSAAAAAPTRVESYDKAKAAEAERKIKLLEDKTRKLEADYGAIMIKYGSLDAELKAAKASMQAHLEERCKLQGELLDSERKIGRMNQEMFAFRGAGLSQEVSQEMSQGGGSHMQVQQAHGGHAGEGERASAASGKRPRGVDSGSGRASNRSASASSAPRRVKPKQTLASAESP